MSRSPNRGTDPTSTAAGVRLGTTREISALFFEIEPDLVELGDFRPRHLPVYASVGHSFSIGRKAWTGGIDSTGPLRSIPISQIARAPQSENVVSPKRRAPEARDLSAMIAIPAGTYQNHAGKEVELDRFWIDAHEVTIAEYAAFLNALASLEESMRSAYDHITQPAIKLDHLPDDWPSVLSAARAGRNHDGLDLDLNCPVTRIDWWDAHAYANWKGGRLPTQEEWLAAATLDREEAISAGGWGPVDQSAGEVSRRRIHGLAGNVAEWSENPERNPAFPMNARSPLACGGTFLAPGGGVRARIWLNTREVRRRDVGFRLVRQVAPGER